MTSFISHSAVSQKVSAALEQKIQISYPNAPYMKKTIVIGDLVHAILSEIAASAKIQESCTSIEAVLTGSYLTNQVVPIHPIVNDKDLKIYFRLRDGRMKYELYQEVRKIAAKYLITQVDQQGLLSFTHALFDIGATKDHSTPVKNTLLGFIQLSGEAGECPLDLSMVFADGPYLTHLTNIDSLEVPIQLCGSGLGSEDTPGEFIIRSKEGENIEEILSQLEQYKITSSRKDWDPSQVNYFELARYFIWICEKCTESGSAVFSCFYQGSIDKNSPRDLWDNLCKLVMSKRNLFAQYPFLLFCNFLFHVRPPIDASSYLLALQDVFDSLLDRMPRMEPLKDILYTEDKN